MRSGLLGDGRYDAGYTRSIPMRQGIAEPEVMAAGSRHRPAAMTCRNVGCEQAPAIERRMTECFEIWELRRCWLRLW